MPFKWTTENIICLIELHRNAECLWNPRDKKYKDRYQKQDLWVEICNGIGDGVSVEEVKRKMKNLVAQFYREKKKYRTYQKSGAGAYFISKWFTYKHLKFLSEKNSVRPCTEKGIDYTYEPDSAISSNDDIDDDANDGIQDDSEYNNIIPEENEQLSAEHDNVIPETQDGLRPQSENMDQIDDDVKLQKEKQISAVIEKPQISEKLDAGFKRPKKKRRTQKSKREAEERQEEAYMFLKDLQQKNTKDQFSIFGEHVACKLRSLKTEFAQNTVEHLIGNILWEASTGKYDHPYAFNVPAMPTATASLGASPSYSLSATLSSPEYAPSPLPRPLSSTDTQISSNNQESPNGQRDIIYTALSTIL